MVSEYIEKAWAAYKKNFWTIISAKILEFVIVGIVLLVFLATAFAMFLPNLMTAMTSGTTNLQVIMLLLFSSIPALIMAIIGVVITVILFIEFEAGMVGIYADSLKGKARLETLFSVMKEKFWSVLGANLLVMLISLLLACIFIFPALLLLAVSLMIGIPVLVIGIIVVLLVVVLFSVVNQAIVIDGNSAAAALEKSVKVIKANYLSAIALILIFFVINMVLQIIGMAPMLMIPMLIIVLLVVAPLQMISFTALYLEKSGAAPAPRAAKPKPVVRRRK
ncbi:MAG: hypothetical protein HZB67_06040 [Candidatus Aenigmarchaeota archaeon]|nr:hypothetical protein [Candidatus Aenigmarchaeota archaeon]